MSSSNNNEREKTRSRPEGKEVKRSRRPQTSAEKAARQQKRLRDQYGNSRLDPDEPLLHGLTAAALQCAFTLLRQAYRRRGGYNPKTIADKVACICGLPGEQREHLLQWLTWVKPRRWVVQEEGRSSVVAWANTSLSKSAIWTAELDAWWRAALESPNATKAVDRAPSSPAQQPGATVAAVRPATAVAIPSQESAAHPDPKLANGPDERMSHDLFARDETAGRSNPAAPAGGSSALSENLVTDSPLLSRSGASQLIDRQRIAAFPDPAFGTKKFTANRFAEAALKFIKGQGAADDLRAAATALAANIGECREFCERSPAHRRFVESIFNQLGWEVP